VTAAWEEQAGRARAARLAEARQFAAGRGLPERAGEYLAAAVDTGPGINLTRLDQFPPAMREAAAAILPRAAYGPGHEFGAREHLATAARMASQGRDQQSARWLAEAAHEVTRAGDRRAAASARRADERAQAARAVDCACDARAGVACGPSGDHLARYLRAEQTGVITRESLTEVIGGLDVIAPQVIIQPTGDRAAHAAAAEMAGQVVRAQVDAGASPGQIEASAEDVLGGRSGHPAPASAAFYHGYDEVTGIYTREAEQWEAGA